MNEKNYFDMSKDELIYELDDISEKKKIHDTLFTVILAALSFRRVNSYPLTLNSMGSPNGALFTNVTSVSGVNPMFRIWLLNALLLLSIETTVAFCPTLI